MELLLIVSLNWILNNDRDQIEKSMLDIEDYLDSMGNDKTDVDLGDDNPGFEESKETKEKEETKETEFVAGDPSVEFKDMKQQQGDKDSTQIDSKKLQRCPDENISVTVDNNEAKDNGTMFNFFNIKMILIGSAALMFSKICGNTHIHIKSPRKLANKFAQ